MLYYRTHVSRGGELPTELRRWRSPAQGVQLSENTVGEHRVVGVLPPFVFAPPETGWVQIEPGWEAANAGPFTAMWHAHMDSQFLCAPVDLGGTTWLLPIVLNDEGRRAFKVSYGGPAFSPIISAEQRAALDLAEEIRTSMAAGTLPDMSIRAAWAAQLLSLTYCMSQASFGIVGLGEDLIAETLRVAGGMRGKDA